ncbi:MAG: PIN domain-containing protein [Chitinophagaceae bacterium]|nr:PIN domain-containing protein [Chitinophagaceae bacterium]
MRIFIDANVLVSILNKEYPVFSYSARILSLAESNRFQVFTSPICLAIAFYFAEKKHRAVAAKQKIEILCKHIRIADSTQSSVQKTLANPAIKDFEDGLEYYAAVENKCACIITEDKDDFYFSEIEVINSQQFFEKYMSR